MNVNEELYYDTSFPIEKLLLLRRSSLLHYFENYNNTSIEKIEDLFSKRLEVAEQLTLEIKLARILSILSYQYFNNKSDTKLLQSFMNEPFMKNESLAKDFSTKYLYHWVHAQFHEFKNNNSKAHEHFSKSIKVWLNHPQYIEAHPKIYLGACFNYFKYLLHQEDPFTKVLYDINYKGLMSKVLSENLGAVEEAKHLFLFTLFRVISLRHQYKFVEIKKIVRPYLEKNDFMDSLPNYEKIIISYYDSLASYNLKDLSSAHNSLFDYANPLDERLAENPVYLPLYTILYLIILYEQGNKKLLKIKLKKATAYLESNKRLTPLVSHFIRMFSQLISPRYENGHNLVYDRFYKRLTQAKNSRTTGFKIEFNFFLDWVNNKRMDL